MLSKKPISHQAIGGAAGRALRTLCVATAGAGLAHVLNWPLAFVIGPCLATVLARRLWPDLSVHTGLRNLALATAGACMGANVPAHSPVGADQWLIYAATLVPFVAVAALLASGYLRWVGRYDRATAWLSAQPGGILAMLSLSERMNADTARVLYIHSVRIILGPVLVTALMTRLVHEIPPMPLVPPEALTVDVGAYAVFFLAAAGGWATARSLRLPGSDLLGPLLMVLLCTRLDCLHITLPAWPMMFALGTAATAVGCAFAPSSGRRLLVDTVHALLLTLLYVALAFAMAWLMHWGLGVSARTYFLAAVPSGLTEMSALAWVLGLDASLVACMATWRFVLSAWLGASFAWIDKR